MHKIKIGDLCRPANILSGSKTIIVSDVSMANALFSVDAECLLAVTDCPPRTRLQDVSLAALCNAISYDNSDGRVSILQVIVASGPHAGSVGYVPSFWLQVVMSAGS